MILTSQDYLSDYILSQRTEQPQPNRCGIFKRQWEPQDLLWYSCRTAWLVCFIMKALRSEKVLAKFLDLEIFDEMHKAVKKDSAEMQALSSTLTLLIGKRITQSSSWIFRDLRRNSTSGEWTLLKDAWPNYEMSRISMIRLLASQRSIDIDKLKETSKRLKIASKKQRKSWTTYLPN